jgi:hypothetical protein
MMMSMTEARRGEARRGVIPMRLPVCLSVRGQLLERGGLESMAYLLQAGYDSCAAADGRVGVWFFGTCLLSFGLIKKW